VLRLANSPLHALLRRVESLQEALVVIGLDRLKRLVVTVASRTYAKEFLDRPELHRCWRHMLACGLLAEEIARACSIDADHAYTAGLMHDAGRLGLLVAYSNDYADLLRDADLEGAADDTTFLLDRERDKFGIDHCEAGQELAEKWGLPETFALIAGRHHDRHYGAEFALLDAVALGCRLADSLGFGVIHTDRAWSIEQAREQLPARARTRFWSDRDALRSAILERLEELDPGHLDVESPRGSAGTPDAESAVKHAIESLPASPPQSVAAEESVVSESLATGAANVEDAVEDGEVPSNQAGNLAASEPPRADARSGVRPNVGEFNWAPLVLIATALAGLLLLLLWDPLGAG
jgi:HD-like signal output (HDOD) protein